MLLILLRRMCQFEEESAEQQTAYRKGKGYPDLLVMMQILIDKLTATNRQASLIFIDYSKAFDTPSHTQLFGIMCNVSFPTIV